MKLFQANIQISKNPLTDAAGRLRLAIPDFSGYRTKLGKWLNIYTAIFTLTLVASIAQLDLLGRGIAARFEEPAVVQKESTSASNTTATNIAEFKPERIIIKSVDIDLPVVSVPLQNGTWQVYPKVANFAEGTSLVSKKGGNVGIFAHDRLDAFSKIKELLTGYDIIVQDKNYKAIYKVQTVSIVSPNDVNIFYPTKQSTLTLVTCEGIFSEKRYMVTAELVTIEKIK